MQVLQGSHLAITNAANVFVGVQHHRDIQGVDFVKTPAQGLRHRQIEPWRNKNDAAPRLAQQLDQRSVIHGAKGFHSYAGPTVNCYFFDSF